MTSHEDIRRVETDLALRSLDRPEPIQRQPIGSFRGFLAGRAFANEDASA